MLLDQGEGRYLIFCDVVDQLKSRDGTRVPTAVRGSDLETERDAATRWGLWEDAHVCLRRIVARLRWAGQECRLNCRFGIALSCAALSEGDCMMQVTWPHALA